MQRLQEERNDLNIQRREMVHAQEGLTTSAEAISHMRSEVIADRVQLQGGWNELENARDELLSEKADLDVSSMICEDFLWTNSYYVLTYI